MLIDFSVTELFDFNYRFVNLKILSLIPFLY